MPGRSEYLNMKALSTKKVMSSSADEVVKKFNNKSYEELQHQENEQKKDEDNQISLFKEKGK